MKLDNGKTKKTVPVNMLLDQMDNSLISYLPAIHALNGCDSTSKVGRRLASLKTSMDISLLKGFGVDELSLQMISNAENFFVSGLKSTTCSTFDEYRWEHYHNSKKLTLISLSAVPQRYNSTSKELIYSVRCDYRSQLH